MYFVPRREVWGNNRSVILIYYCWVHLIVKSLFTCDNYIIHYVYSLLQEVVRRSSRREQNYRYYKINYMIAWITLIKMFSKVCCTTIYCPVQAVCTSPIRDQYGWYILVCQYALSTVCWYVNIVWYVSYRWVIGTSVRTGKTTMVFSLRNWSPLPKWKWSININVPYCIISI